jgi:glycosyltransferase involved in cell wall biosynthesis
MLASGMINNPDQRMRIAAAGRKRVEEAFSLQKMVNGLEAIYSDLKM